MRRIRDGDEMELIVATFVSEIRNYPVGTRITVEHYIRELDADGYITTDSPIRARIKKDGSVLHFFRREIAHIEQERGTA